MNKNIIKFTEQPQINTNENRRYEEAQIIKENPDSIAITSRNDEPTYYLDATNGFLTTTEIPIPLVEMIFSSYKWYSHLLVS